MYSRKEAVHMIKHFVTSCPLITAAWEGGSIATGYSDDYSDLDLYLVCKTGDKESILQDLLNFLHDRFGEEKSYRMPEPAWHGFSQVFFKTKDTPELFYVDFVVIGEDVEDKLTEVNRHGKGQVWVEKYKIDTRPRGKDKIKTLGDRLYNETIQKDFIVILELKKALKRQIFTEAFPIYMTLISKFLVTLMNIKYRPEKADFGLRYIYRDYPKEEYLFVENALKISTMDQMETYTEDIMSKYQQLLLELK